MGLPDEINIRIHYIDGERKVVDLGSSFNDLPDWKRNSLLEFLSHTPDELEISGFGKRREYRLERPNKGIAHLDGDIHDIDYTYKAISDEGTNPL